MSGGEVTLPYCPQDLKGLITGDDHFIGQFSVKDDMQTPLCVVTAKNMFLCDAAKSPKWAKKWLEIHSIHPKGDTDIVISFLNPKKNVKSPLDDKLITLETRTQRELWLIVLRRLTRDSHQAFFESLFNLRNDL